MFEFIDNFLLTKINSTVVNTKRIAYSDLIRIIYHFYKVLRFGYK